ncbi:hypothetical protein TIFTF001_029377 [Ficus carica]|uniref:Uncharacterized protein n=1 Tax=Ficus carica TaxID=3494 RepID=A0AA88DRM5_FICCA|nr:hypothetical protein TIFTF001_029377 [Ficus carica]
MENRTKITLESHGESSENRAENRAIPPRMSLEPRISDEELPNGTQIALKKTDYCGLSYGDRRLQQISDEIAVVSSVARQEI